MSSPYIIVSGRASYQYRQPAQGIEPGFAKQYTLLGIANDNAVATDETVITLKRSR